MARDGSDAGRGTEPAVVPQSFRARNADYDELTADAVSRPGCARSFLASVPDGRADAASGCERAGAWVGLDRQTPGERLVRSILEGVCYSLKDGLEIIRELGARPATTRLSGGGARSPLWHQLFANIFNQRVTTLETQEGSAFGAALLAAIGTKQFSQCHGSMPGQRSMK